MTALDISPLIDPIIRAIEGTVQSFGQSCCTGGAIIGLVVVGAIVWMVKVRA
jgi:hypothetical protein